ncbi:hypothetical protein [Ideonella sp. YS5]|uniref:hypothetical protein n=1 Tax=Ideonella sp. YS5 TaxID=3453714 RepID=UPI003EE8D887
MSLGIINSGIHESHAAKVGKSEMGVSEVQRRDDAAADARRFAQCLQNAEPLLGDSTELANEAVNATPSSSWPVELGYGVFMRA